MMGSDEPCRHHALDRRAFLGLAGASATTAGLAALLGAAPANAAQAGREDGGAGAALRFAMVSDTHVNVTSPRSTTWLGQVYAAIARRGPDFVLHCGDITDTGLPEEYDQYAQTLPASLLGKIHYSPGNHEVRWDASAKELYHAHFGPAPYSFDAGGVHFIGFDPTQVLQEPGHYGPDGLRWLEQDLRRLAPGTPAVLFQHFPMGNDFYYVDDQPSVLDLVASYNVRGFFVGHLHREAVSTFNGMSQVLLNAVLNGPMYYWAEKSATADGTSVLRVSRFNVAADGTETQTAVTTVPLAGGGLGRPQRPRRVTCGPVSGGTLPVTVITGPAAQPRQVSAQPYQQVIFGGTGTSAPQPLTSAAGGAQWTGSVDVSGIAPGRQRLHVKVTAPDGTWWEDVAPFTVPAAPGDPAPRWQHQLAGAVQGGIALAGPAGDVIVAAATSGQVAAYRHAGGPRVTPLWQARIGPVYRRPGVSADGRTLFAPSTDHHLYALDAATGRARWRFEAGAPLLGAPAVASVGGAESVFFPAGQDLFAVDAATGRQLWSVPGRGFSSGRAACDGTAVYTAAGDGYARAHDARTGQEIWSYQMVSGVEHHVLLYSGWDDVVAVSDGLAIVGTVSRSWALDAATGAPRWTFPGSTMYAPTVPLGDGTALFTTEYGVLSRVSLADGSTVWQSSLGVRVFNAGVVVSNGTAWVQTVDGKLIGVRVSDGTRQGWVQHSLAYCFAAPAVTAGTLVTGDQNGVVHGIQLP